MSRHRCRAEDFEAQGPYQQGTFRRCTECGRRWRFEAVPLTWHGAWYPAWWRWVDVAFMVASAALGLVVMVWMFARP